MENSAQIESTEKKNSDAPKKNKVVLKLKHVYKKIGRKQIINDLSFSVRQGEIFGFLGPNGAGKTTTIKMIVGLLKIDKGEIYIDGRSVKKNYEKALKNVGGIIESPEMYEYLSGKKNLKIFGRMHGHISKERYAEIIEQVGLTSRIKDKVKKYSLGMRQRLGIAQALLHRPKLLILDEPTNGLDPAGIRDLRNYLRRLTRQENMAVLVSSHLLSEMELMCDRFCIIDKGVLVDIKSLSDISSEKGDELSEYNIYADDVESALKIASELVTQAEIKDEHLVLNANRDTVIELNAKLVSEGIGVFGIEKTKRTLEDEFIDKTSA